MTPVGDGGSRPMHGGGLLAAFALLLVGCASQAPPGLFDIRAGSVVYARRDGLSLRMTIAAPTVARVDEADPIPALDDLRPTTPDAADATASSLPAPAPDGRYPVLLILHGGAFNYGSRAQTDALARHFARQGWVAASADYRLAPRHPFPAAVQDAFAALRFLRSRARRLGGDPERVAVMGMSAGATLAMTIGYCNEPEEVFGECGDTSIATDVRAVVNVYGPCDLAYNFDRARWWLKPLVLNYLGCRPDQCPERWRLASPRTFIAPGAPPTLTVHGYDDRVVGFEQAELLDEALRDVGTRHYLVGVDAAHGWGYAFGSRDSYAMLPVVTTFLERELR